MLYLFRRNLSKKGDGLKIPCCVLTESKNEIVSIFLMDKRYNIVDGLKEMFSMFFFFFLYIYMCVCLFVCVYLYIYILSYRVACNVTVLVDADQKKKKAKSNYTRKIPSLPVSRWSISYTEPPPPSLSISLSIYLSLVQCHIFEIPLHSSTLYGWQVI